MMHRVACPRALQGLALALARGHGTMASTHGVSGSHSALRRAQASCDCPIVGLPPCVPYAFSCCLPCLVVFKLLSPLN